MCEPMFYARLLSRVAPQICCAKIALGPSARFADCPAEEFSRWGDMWVDVLRAVLVPRSPALLRFSFFFFYNDVSSDCSFPNPPPPSPAFGLGGDQANATTSESCVRTYVC